MKENKEEVGVRERRRERIGEENRRWTMTEAEKNKTLRRAGRKNGEESGKGRRKRKTERNKRYCVERCVRESKTKKTGVVAGSELER